MEEVLINVHYLLREKLWGSARAYCDMVIILYLLVGTQQGTRRHTHLLESIQHF